MLKGLLGKIDVAEAGIVGLLPTPPTMLAIADGTTGDLMQMCPSVSPMSSPLQRGASMSSLRSDASVTSDLVSHLPEPLHDVANESDMERTELDEMIAAMEKLPHSGHIPKLPGWASVFFFH